MPQIPDKVPVWLDCDPGHDDAFAILVAAYHDRLQLLGISTVHGNASLAKTTNNALSVLKAISKDVVPVFPGSAKPFCTASKHAPEVHGESGLDGTDLLPQPSRLPLSHCNAIKEMRDHLMSCLPQTAWLVATGALTNVALLFTVFPEVVDHLKGLSIMGGAIGDDFTHVYMGPDFVEESTGRKRARIGNMTPFAEFNIWCDPAAAKSIFSNSELASKTSLITLDLTHQVCATEQVRKLLLYGRDKRDPPTRLRRMFYELLVFFAKTYADVFGLTDGPPLHDPVAVSILLNQFCEASGPLFDDSHHERWQVEVEIDGEQAGRTKIVPVKSGVFVPRRMDLTRFWDMVEDCMAKADKATNYAGLN